MASVPADDVAVYRGWMLTSERYAGFTAALARRGVTARTGAEQYRRAHELPGWYPALAAHTPRSAWTTGADRADFDRARADLPAGAAIVRDYVKSMKHYWHEATFIPDLGDADAAWAVAARFRQLRDDDFTGGYVLREFESFTTAEVRTWWLDGRCVLVGPHPDTPDVPPPDGLDLGWLRPLIGALGLPFVTADLADRRGRRRAGQRPAEQRRPGRPRRRAGRVTARSELLVYLRVAALPAPLQPADRRHLLLVQLEREHVQVLRLPLR